MKTCFKCGEMKPLADFYKHKEMADGHLNKCKECAKYDSRNNRSNNLEYYLEYDRQRANQPKRVAFRETYAKSEAGLAAARKSNKRYRKRNAKKVSASAEVKRAVEAGILIKAESCESCGVGSCESVLHGHHDDYNKPLDVRWLCPACHAAWHKENGEGKNG